MRPDTTPAADTDAVAGLLLLHVPPGAVADNEIVKPAHTFDAPAIVPADGAWIIVIIFIALAAPHALVTVYLIVSRPAVTPVTSPVVDTVAFALLAVHTPPGVASARDIEAVLHTVDGPVIAATVGAEPIVTTTEATAIPQLLLTVYDIVSIPAVTPVTIPPATVALPLLALHVPPGAASVSVRVVPVHTLVPPMIAPASGSGFTVVILIAVAVPQLLVTV